METDIGNPIEYSPNMDPLIQEKNEDNTEELVQDQPYYPRSVADGSATRRARGGRIDGGSDG